MNIKSFAVRKGHYRLLITVDDTTKRKHMEQMVRDELNKWDGDSSPSSVSQVQ